MKKCSKPFLFSIIISILFYKTIFAQSNSTPFVVSSESKIALFSQSDARIFPDSNKGFIVSWVDSRLGDSKYFAQKYNSDLSKIGANYETFSNSLILYSTTGKSFSIYDSSYSYYNFPWDERGGTRFIGIIHDDLSASKTIDLGGGEYPTWIEFWSGEGYSAVKSKNDFISVSDIGGRFQVTKIFEDGTDSLIVQNNNENYFVDISNTSIAINNKGEYAIASFNIADYDDTTSVSGIYVQIFSNNDTLISIKCVKPIIDYEYPQHFPKILATSISDSLFQIFISDSSKVICIKINNLGNILESKSIPVMNGTYNYGDWWQRQTFTLSNINENKRALILTFDVRKVYKNLFYLDKDGEFVGEPIIDTTSSFQYNSEIFLDKNEHLIFTKTVDKDVYLYKCNNFDVIDSLKINDDISGSNEVRPAVKKGENNGFYLHWINEIDNVGQMLNGKGKFVGENQILNNLSFSFFNDGSRLEPWSKTLASGMKQMGFTIYDKDSNVVASIPLTVESGSEIIRLNLQIINENEFIAGYFSNGKNYLAKYSKGGTRNAYTEVGVDSSYSTANILLDDDYFYFKIGSNLYKHDYYLNLLKEMKEFTYFTNYIGKSRFIAFYSDYENFGQLTCKIYDEDGTEINSLLGFGSTKNYKMGFAKSGQFILFSEQDGKLISNTFDMDGNNTIPDFVVYTLENEKVRDLNFEVNGDQILFTWSGRKLDKGNYDIYAVIYDLDLLTGIKDKISEPVYSFSLEQNYPNPFNPSTIIKYSISVEDALNATTTNVSLKIYDILGREVTTLVNKLQKAGNYEVEFNAENLSSGMYFAKLHFGSLTSVKKMLLLK